MTTKNILILGGLGFIGRNLIAQLTNHYQLIVFDRGEAPESRNFTFYRGDLAETNDLEKIFQNHRVDLVIHLVSSTIPSSQDAVFDIESNLVHTVRLLELMKKYSVPKILFVSSGGTVYGAVAETGTVGEDHPTNPISSHGIVKLAIEKYIHLYHHLYGLNYLIVRFANPYGEYHASHQQGLINVALRRAIAKEPFVVWGDGHIVRDYIYVKDGAAIVRELIDRGISNEILNVGTGVGHSVNEILELVQKVAGPLKIERQESRDFDVPRIVLNTEKLRSIVDVQLTNIEQGVQNTFSWLKSEHGKT